MNTSQLEDNVPNLVFESKKKKKGVLYDCDMDIHILDVASCD